MHIFNVADFADGCVVHSMVPSEDRTANIFLYSEAYSIKRCSSCCRDIIGDDINGLVLYDINKIFIECSLS